jgi:hypothetical protein
MVLEASNYGGELSLHFQLELNAQVTPQIKKKSEELRDVPR